MRTKMMPLLLGVITAYILLLQFHLILHSGSLDLEITAPQNIQHSKLKENPSYDATSNSPPASRRPPSTRQEESSHYQHPRNETSLAHRPICFVHVGKTAGGTLSCRLNRNLAKSCPVNSTATHKPFWTTLVQGKLHKHQDWGCLHDQVHKKNKKKHNIINPPPHHYLFALRDPIERFQSWFHYEHPALGHVEEILGNRPKLYTDCFDNLQEFSLQGVHMALKGMDNKDGNDSKKLVCAQRAWKAVQGTIGFQYHNAYNYRYYWEWVQQMASTAAQQTRHSSSSLFPISLLVIRSEHLQSDWDRLNLLFGEVAEQRNSDHTDYFASVQRHKSSSATILSKNHSEGTMFNPQVLHYLCLGLCDELHLYRELLEDAINLTTDQKRQSWHEIEIKCPGLPKTSEMCPRIHDTVRNHVDPAKMVGIPRYSTKAN